MANTNQLQGLLRITYGFVPIVTGLDKFTNFLTNWDSYLGSGIKSMLPIEVMTFMKIIGIVEIIAGIIVLVRPIVGGYVVMVWLICIALQLIIGGHYLDVAVRDLVMALGAYTLAQLSRMTVKV